MRLSRRRGYRPSILSLLVFAVLASITVVEHAQAQSKPSAAVIFRGAKPSIVYIIAGDASGNPTVQGSGFIIGKNEVVTNHHVVAGTASAMAVFSDGASALITTVIADSAKKDLIVLGVSTGTRPALPLGDELALQQGDTVYAIGAPKGLELSFTNGMVSAFRNTDDQFLIQSTAAIGHGSSGGPLLNDDGKVVGITSTMMSDTPGIYFSESVGDLKRMMRNPDLLTLEFSEWAKTNKGDRPVTTNGEEGASSTATEVSQIEQFLNDKKFDEARSLIVAMRSRAPDAALTHRMIGEYDRKTGDDDGALQEFQLAVDKDGSDSLSQFYLGLSLYGVRRFNEALDHEIKSHALEPTASDAPILAVMYYAVGNYQQAENWAKNSLTSDPKNELALSVYAGLAFYSISTSIGSWAEVIKQLRAVNPDNFWAHVSDGYSSWHDSKFADAESAFVAANKDYFPDSIAYAALTSLYIGQSELGKANDQIKMGLVEVPNDVRLLSSGVFVALLTRDNTEAGRRFDLIEKLYPNSRDALSEGCLYYYGVGQAASALPYCDRLTQQFPNDRIAHSNYGWAALDANNFQLASAEFSRAYKIASADWSKLNEKETIDLLWGSTLALYYSGDKKGTSEIIKIIRKSYPAAATITGLQQYPLLWSPITMTRIEGLLRKFPN